MFGAYFLAGQLGLAIPFTNGNVSPVWPAAGIALAAFLVVGYRVWPALVAAAFVVNYFSSISLPGALAIAVGNTAGPFFGAWLVRRVPGFRPSLSRLGDVLGLIRIGAPASAAISASVGVTVLFMTHVDPWVRFWPAWIVWWLGDATGALLVAPLALTLLARTQVTQGRHVRELVALCSATVITCFAVFDARLSLGMDKDVFAFAVLPLVLWGASRFELPGAAGVTLLIACMAVWETTNGYGPFVRNGTLQNAIMLQAFIAALLAWGLILAAAIAERAHLIREQAHREGFEQNDRRYRPMVETAHDGIWMLDAELITVFVNPRMAAMLGCNVDEMHGKPLSVFVRDTAWAEKQERLRQPGLAQGGDVQGEHAQVQYLRKDGSELWADVFVTRRFHDNGTFTGVLKMVSDMSMQRRTEGERQEALDRVGLLSKAVEQTADTVLITDSTGRIEYVNPAFEATTGFTEGEALGKTPRLLKSGHHGTDFYHHLWSRLLAGEPYRGTLVNRKKSGELYWANQTITPIKDPQGTITHFVAVLKDVTAVRKYHEQEVQLRLARAVQQRFYPVTPRVAGLDIAAASHPAAETGGDYYDFIDAPDGTLYVAIGDVSGHGFDAALIMALTTAYVRSYATLGMDVGEVLGRVNRAIIGDLEPERYVTMLLVRLDVEAATISYANAGHIPGVLLSSEGVDCMMESTGVPLGLFADVAFATRHCRLSTRQILLLGTDGATEASDANDVEFGCDGVIEYVRSHAHHTAEEIATGVYDAARSFSASHDQHDDITSVVIKVTNVAHSVDQAPLPLDTRVTGSARVPEHIGKDVREPQLSTTSGAHYGLPGEQVTVQFDTRRNRQY